MAWDDNRERVAPQRRPHGTRRARLAQPPRNGPVRRGRTRWNVPRRLAYAAVKRRHVIHVENDGRKITALTAQEGNDCFDCALHVGWRHALAANRTSPQQPRTRHLENLASLARSSMEDLTWQTPEPPAKPCRN
jgi:hypothetical protein